MLFRLVSLMKRSGSSIPYFAQRIPSDVRTRAIGRILSVPVGDQLVAIKVTPRTESIRFSLRTRDPVEAKIRHGRAAAHLEGLWRSLRVPKPVALSQRQATALSGELYRAWVNEDREKTVAVLWTPQGWVPAEVTAEENGAFFRSVSQHLDKAEGIDGAPNLEAAFGPLIDRLLQTKGIVEVDAESRPVLLEAFRLALRDAMQQRERNARFDYSPDPNAERFPKWAPRSEQSEPERTHKKATLTGLVEDWWREAESAGRKPSTHESYKNSFTGLQKFLRHNDALQVTPEDIIRFKDDRLATPNRRTRKPVSAKTVKDSDLSAFKTVFGWAVANRRIPANPATGITIKVGKARKLRSKGFADAEAQALLTAASNPKPSHDAPKTAAAKRWVPWLCAYTGALPSKGKRRGPWRIRMAMSP
jgi:hypothetical protein